jgi:toxin ParE1/3/4
MSYRVALSPGASDDIEAIIRYIGEHDSDHAAQRVLSGIESSIVSLTELAERGNMPKELVAIGIRRYRETHYKPYRIIYWVEEEAVTVALVADGRRDMQRLLARRLAR